MLKTWRAIPAQLAAVLKHQILIHREIIAMRVSTNHLIAAVSALALAVADSTKKIDEEVAALKAAHDDGDDAAVEAAATRLGELTGQLNTAVENAKTAADNVPTDPAAVTEPAPGATGNPAAAPPDQATQTGVDPASGAPAGQGAVQAGS